MSRTESDGRLRAKFWHDRAEEAWSMASQMTDLDAKTSLVEIAERYDTLADSIAAKEAMLYGRENRRAGRRDPISPGALV